MTVRWQWLLTTLCALALDACEAIPPCPPQPQWPTPPVSAPWLVFFEPGSSRISPQSMQSLQTLANVIKTTPGSRVFGTAHSDRAGDEVANYILSRQRGEAVGQALVALGVAADRYSVRPVGEHMPLVPTRRGIAEPQNRRVALSVSPTPEPKWPPDGYRAEEMRCVISSPHLVPVKPP